MFLHAKNQIKGQSIAGLLPSELSVKFGFSGNINKPENESMSLFKVKGSKPAYWSLRLSTKTLNLLPYPVKPQNVSRLILAIKNSAKKIYMEVKICKGLPYL